MGTGGYFVTSTTEMNSTTLAVTGTSTQASSTQEKRRTRAAIRMGLTYEAVP